MEGRRETKANARIELIERKLDLARPDEGEDVLVKLVDLVLLAVLRVLEPLCPLRRAVLSILLLVLCSCSLLPTPLNHRCSDSPEGRKVHLLARR